MDSQDRPLQPGEMVAERYRVEALIGRGGFGAVYRATELRLDRLVALKVLLPSLVKGPNTLQRFRQEVELAQRLEHPNTVRLYDFGETEQGLPFISWEFLRGRSLEEVLAREGGMSAMRVVRIGGQVLKSLMEAHGHGIVHRDIKPANVFLSDHAGEPDFVKVLDFGVAKLAARESGAHLTQQGQAVGTPSYMAPEQVVSDPVDARTDVYALGLTLAEMLSGRRVYVGDVAMKICIAQASRDPVPLAPEVTESPIGAVIERATQKQPSQRYDSAADMLLALEQAAGVSVPPPRAVPPVTTQPDAAQLGTADTIASDPNLAVAMAPTQPSGVPALSSGSQPVPPAVMGQTGQPLTVVRASSRARTSFVVAGTLLGTLALVAVLLFTGVIPLPRGTLRFEAQDTAPAGSGVEPPTGPAAEHIVADESLQDVSIKGHCAQEILDALADDGWHITAMKSEPVPKVHVQIYLLSHPKQLHGTVQFQGYESAEDASASVGILRSQAAAEHGGRWLLFMLINGDRELSKVVLERVLK